MLTANSIYDQEWLAILKNPLESSWEQLLQDGYELKKGEHEDILELMLERSYDFDDITAAAEQWMEGYERAKAMELLLPAQETLTQALDQLLQQRYEAICKEAIREKELREKANTDETQNNHTRIFKDASDEHLDEILRDMLDQAPDKPPSLGKMRRQEIAILNWLRVNQFDPKNLPDPHSGKAGPKKAAYTELTKSNTDFAAKSAFKNAWDRLCSDDEIQFRA